MSLDARETRVEREQPLLLGRFRFWLAGLSAEDWLRTIEVVLWPLLALFVLLWPAAEMLSDWWLAFLVFPSLFLLSAGSLPFAAFRNRLKTKKVKPEPIAAQVNALAAYWQDTSWIRHTLLAIQAVGFLGILTLALSLEGFGAKAWGILANGIMIAGAAFLTGSVGGFLFGIPKTLQRDLASQSQRAEGEQNNGRTTYLVNTNLEQISDWLTKIIVGVGLVELRRAPEYIDRLGDFLFQGMVAGTVSPAPFTQSTLVAMVFFYFADGLLSGYLMTRIYLSGAFQRADETIEDLARAALTELAAAELDQPVGSRTGGVVEEGQFASSKAVSMLLAKVETEAREPYSLDPRTAEVVGNAYFHTQNYDRSIPYLQRSRASGAASPQAILKLAIALGETNRRSEAVKLLEGLAKSENTPPPATFKLLGYFLLWNPRALHLSIDNTKKYLQQTPKDDDGGAFFNLACAHAQLYGQGRRSESPDAKIHRESALENLELAIRKDERWRERARQLQSEPFDFADLAKEPAFLILTASEYSEIY